MIDIGNARIAGLDESLSLSSSQYAWLLTSFYITYVSFEWMTLLYRIVPPHIYISVCVLSWGIIASLQSVCTSFIPLAILRGFLGVAEAAFGPGVPFYLTFFYKRSELAYRVGIFIAAAPLATSFASTLAWVIVKVSQNGPIEPWRLLFLIEGFPSVIVAFFAFYVLPDSPSTTRYFTVRERRVAKLRLQHDSETPNENKARGIKFSEVLATLRDPKAYFTALMFFSANVAFSSLPVFLPTILRDMSFSPLASQGLAAPPYLCAFGFLLLTAHFSDKIPNSRAWFIIGVAVLSSASYAAIALTGALHERIGDSGTLTIRYIGVYGAAMGFFSAVTLIITWTLNNQQSATAKGTGMTIIQVVGQCGPLLGVRLFPKSQAPYYVPGMSVCAAFMLLVAILALALRWDLARRNMSQTVTEYEMVGTDDEGLVSGGPPSAPGNGNFKFML
jgi:sugar phosphate permease